MTIETIVKKTAKVAGAACLATGVVAISGLVASGAAVGAVVEGFKAAKDTMKTVLKEELVQNEDSVAEETNLNKQDEIIQNE